MPLNRQYNAFNIFGGHMHIFILKFVLCNKFTKNFRSFRLWQNVASQQQQQSWLPHLGKMEYPHRCMSACKLSIFDCVQKHKKDRINGDNDDGDVKLMHCTDNTTLWRNYSLHHYNFTWSDDERWWVVAMCSHSLQLFTRYEDKNIHVTMGSVARK